jgi:hypothetical protein
MRFVRRFSLQEEFPDLLSDIIERDLRVTSRRIRLPLPLRFGLCDLARARADPDSGKNAALLRRLALFALFIQVLSARNEN